MTGKIATMTEFHGTDIGSISEVLERSGTNWDAEVKPAGVQWEAGQAGVKSGGFRAIIRPDTNTALAYVGERFRVNSHRKQLQELDPFVRSGDLIPASVSVWDNGALLAYQFRAPSLDMVIRGSDVVSPLLTMAFAFGSKWSDMAFFCDFRWFCKNQGGKVGELATDRVRHRGDVVGRYGELVSQRIGQLGGELADRYRVMRELPSKQLTGRALYEYFGASLGMPAEEIDRAWVTPSDELTGPAARIPEVLECYQADPCDAEGTVWQAYNAVTRYETHVAGRTPESRNRRMLLGVGGDVAANAFREAARLVA